MATLYNFYLLAEDGSYLLQENGGRIIIGQSIEDNREARITGKTTTESNRLVKIRGEVEVSSERLTKVSGQQIGYSKKEARITGQAVTSEREAKIHGQETINSILGSTFSDRSAKIVGVKCLWFKKDPVGWESKDEVDWYSKDKKKIYRQSRKVKCD